MLQSATSPSVCTLVQSLRVVLGTSSTLQFRLFFQVDVENILAIMFRDRVQRRLQCFCPDQVDLHLTVLHLSWYHTVVKSSQTEYRALKKDRF